MKSIKTIPSADGYHMPAEYACHKGCILIWPQRPKSFVKVYTEEQTMDIY